jgi:hypothetical protein
MCIVALFSISNEEVGSYCQDTLSLYSDNVSIETEHFLYASSGG